MSLWNLIRDFIVTSITGGTLSDGSFIENNMIGRLFSISAEGSATGNMYTNTYFLNIGNMFVDGDGMSSTGYICFGDYLATTLTIISLIFILVACVMFVVKIVKLVGNLVK